MAIIKPGNSSAEKPILQAAQPRSSAGLDNRAIEPAGAEDAEVRGALLRGKLRTLRPLEDSSTDVYAMSGDSAVPFVPAWDLLECSKPDAAELAAIAVSVMTTRRLQRRLRLSAERNWTLRALLEGLR